MSKGGGELDVGDLEAVSVWQELDLSEAYRNIASAAPTPPQVQHSSVDAWTGESSMCC
jgi:hypothetical protein